LNQNSSYHHDGELNGKPYWVDDNRKYAIWYDPSQSEITCWVHGFAQKIGSPILESNHGIDLAVNIPMMKMVGSTDCPTTGANWISNALNIKCSEVDLHGLDLKLGF